MTNEAASHTTPQDRESRIRAIMTAMPSTTAELAARVVDFVAETESLKDATAAHWETTDECYTMCGIDLVVVDEAVTIASTLDRVECPKCLDRLRNGCADCGHDIDEHDGTGVCPICDCPSYRDPDDAAQV